MKNFIYKFTRLSLLCVIPLSATATDSIPHFDTQNLHHAGHSLHGLSPVLSKNKAALTDGKGAYYFQFGGPGSVNQYKFYTTSLNDSLPLHISTSQAQFGISNMYQTGMTNFSLNKASGNGCMIQRTNNPFKFDAYPFYNGLFGVAQEVTVSYKPKYQKISNPYLAYSPDGTKMALFYQLKTKFGNESQRKTKLVALISESSSVNPCPIGDIGLSSETRIIKDMSDYRLRHYLYDSILLNDGTLVTIDQVVKQQSKERYFELSINSSRFEQSKHVVLDTDSFYNPLKSHARLSPFNKGFVYSILERNRNKNFSPPYTGAVSLKFWSKISHNYQKTKETKLLQRLGRRCTSKDKLNADLQYYSIDSNNSGNIVIATRDRDINRTVFVDRFNQNGEKLEGKSFIASTVDPNFNCIGKDKYYGPHLYLYEEFYPNVSVNNGNNFLLITHMNTKSPNSSSQTVNKHILIRKGEL